MEKNKLCRLCVKTYNDDKSKEPRFNLFKNKLNKPIISEELNNLGIFVKENSHSSNTICRPCFNKINILKKAKHIKEEWMKVLGEQSLKRRNEDSDDECGDDEGPVKKKICLENTKTTQTVTISNFSHAPCFRFYCISPFLGT